MTTHHTASAPPLSGERRPSLQPTIVPVFLSSTWLDLRTERAKVEAVLNQFRQTKFRGMEYFGSRSEGAKAVSLGEVEQCLLYIGIFGGRHGSGITEAEYRRARAIHIPVLAYIKTGEIEVDLDPADQAKQQALLAELKSNHDQLVKLFSTPDELATTVAIDLHHWLFEQVLIPRLNSTTSSESGKDETARFMANVVDQLSLGGTLLQALHSQGYRSDAIVSSGEANTDGQQLRALAHRVRQVWVTGVLERTVHAEMMLSLGRHLSASSVDRPWSTHIEMTVSTATVSVHHELSTLQVFGQAERFLLVLGEPGAGKTITLLELTRDLLALYENGQLACVPVVLNLSSWREGVGGMLEWACHEIATTYYVPRAVARKWIEGGRLVLILDGLDEVPAVDREPCVQALNNFLVEFAPPGVAVASRVAEYEALTTRLRLYSAIRLQPLTDAQVDEYLARGGEPLTFLRATLAANAALRALARTPLMLTIMSLAFQHDADLPLCTSQDDLTAPTESDLRHQLFAQYTARMFKRRGITEKERQRTTRRLAWLAKGMQRHGLTVFWLERLQPTWISTNAGLFLYVICTAGLVTLVYAAASLVGWHLVFAESSRSFVYVPRGDEWSPVSSVVMSTVLVDLLRLRLRSGTSDASILAGNALSVLWLVLYFALPAALVVLRSADDSGPLVAALIVLPFWAVYGCLNASRRGGTDVRISDVYRWSWKSAFLGAMAGCLASSAFLGIVRGLYGSGLEWTMRQAIVDAYDDPRAFIEYVFVSWTNVPFAMLGAAAFGTKVVFREQTVRPNQGVRQTAVRAITASVATVASLFVLFYFAEQFPDGVSVVWASALVSVLLGSTAAALCFGGVDIVRHWVIRLLLAMRGQLPLRAVAFLDRNVATIFLRRVGGGYVFIHRMLLEHFASLPD